MQQVRIAKANKGNAVGGVKSDPGVGTRVGDHHVGDAMEPIGPHVDLVVIALAEVIDVVVAVAGREDEVIGTGYDGACNGVG